MKNIIAIASGKGGVGKSTVAVNLAAAFANKEFSPDGKKRNTALVDIDFYGPSIPMLMGGGEIQVDQEEKFIPALRHGVKYISLAFFLKNPDDPIIWRGPMFSRAITQLFRDVQWGEVDICIIDLPPGTGDAQLSLSQQTILSGAIIVTTPQEIALSDVRRAINMFTKVNVPVLGIIENMAGLKLPSGETINVFGKGGGEKLSQDFSLPLLSSLPLDPRVRESSDAGVPAIFNDESLAKEYQNISSIIIEKIGPTREIKITN